MKRAARVAFALVLASGVALLAWAHRFASRDVTPRYDDPAELFKYGSIGAEARYGIPWHIFRVLPTVCASLVPQYPGRRGYENFGLFYDHADSPRPIGVSYREKPVGLVGLNCAACHTGVVRFEKGGARRFVLGMPAHQLDLEAYVNFLVGCARSPAFEPAAMLQAMRRDPSFGWLDELIYRRYDVVARTRDGILAARAAMTWLDRPSPLGPGRIDASALAGARAPLEHGSLFLLDHRREPRSDRDVRARSMALAAGATPSSIDQGTIDRVLAFFAAREPPAWPRPLNDSLAGEGKRRFDAHCAGCHAQGRDGAPPLDGLWLRAPYLRNTLWDLGYAVDTVETAAPWAAVPRVGPSGCSRPARWGCRRCPITTPSTYVTWSTRCRRATTGCSAVGSTCRCSASPNEPSSRPCVRRRATSVTGRRSRRGPTRSRLSWCTNGLWISTGS